MITSTHNGHNIYWDSNSESWKYENGTPLSIVKKCANCNEYPTKDGHDSCLGELPGVEFACCGHGKEEGYLTFTNGVTLRFKLKSIERGI